MIFMPVGFDDALSYEKSVNVLRKILLSGLIVSQCSFLPNTRIWKSAVPLKEALYVQTVVWKKKLTLGSSQEEKGNNG